MNSSKPSATGPIACRRRRGRAAGTVCELARRQPGRKACAARKAGLARADLPNGPTWLQPSCFLWPIKLVAFPESAPPGATKASECDSTRSRSNGLACPPSGFDRLSGGRDLLATATTHRLFRHKARSSGSACARLLPIRFSQLSTASGNPTKKVGYASSTFNSSRNLLLQQRLLLC